MHNTQQTMPSVMSISINDPCGGSGIQADIEAIAAMGSHCTSVISALAINNTSECFQITPLPSEIIWHQAKAILEDMPISAIKLGFLGSVENLQTIYDVLKDYPHLPLVLDPNLYLAPANKLPDKNMVDALIDLILPLTTVCVASEQEIRLMAPQADTLEACAQSLMAHGANYVLITGHRTPAHPFVNSLFGNYRLLDTVQWKLSKHDYHGVNCTLSSSLASLLAQGMAPSSALNQAQSYTEKCLKHGYRLGMGRQLPNRLFWAREANASEEIKKFNQ